ncbi:glycosyltransferase [Hyunsoonleella ulvae]|uniref:glycosyltransferase n=2 Tax=Flavobacteriaceae TaxID=49546 RepID=UPI00193A91E6|nr:glycosyltransferase [Hyunsoonleella ulvae]
MRLSILIPMYNAQSYIERCLKSVLEQDIPKSDYEIIVYDDGSTDGSKDIVTGLTETFNNIRLYSNKNEGVVKVRNKLLSLAKGSYVYFIDADDYIAHNMLGKIIEFSLNNNIDVFGFHTRVTNDENLFSEDKSFVDYELPKIISGSQYLKENKDLRLEIWWYIARRDYLVEKKHCFDEKVTGYDGDVVFTYRLFIFASRVAYSPVSVYRYFQSPESTMRTKTQSFKKRIAEYFLALIFDLENFITSLEHLSIAHKDIIIEHIKSRRDSFVFFTIIKMIRARFGINTFKKNISALTNIGVYPIQYFMCNKYNTFKYRMLNYILNNRFLLFTMVRIHHMVTK